MTTTRRILVVDDEPFARQKLVRYLGRTGGAFDVREAANGLEALDHIDAFQPDIVFLDVEMPGLSGFDVLRNREERSFQVVFQTAYDAFAVRAFEENAVDYLLKPFDFERFRRALDRVLDRVGDGERLAAVETALARRDGPLRRLGVKCGNKFRLLEEVEIDYFISRDHYTFVYFDGGREGIADLSLRHLAERLDPAVFRQFHRNNIVRLAAIVAVTTAADGEVHVELRSGARLPVSRGHRREVRDLVKNP